MSRIAKDLGVDPAVILQSSHGRRSIDTLALYDRSKANWAYVASIEGAIPREYGDSAVEIPGARVLLDHLDSLRAPWAIVTSGTDALLSGWLEVMKLPRPERTVVAEDVPNGKPDPACYVLGRERIGLKEGSRLVVFEDAPAGVAAGKAAGATVMGLATTHSIERVIAAGADYIVKDLRSLSVKPREEGGFEIAVSNAWLEHS